MSELSIIGDFERATLQTLHSPFVRLTRRRDEVARMATKKKKRKNSKEPNWREFESAVSRFVAAIANGATVTHDAKKPDKHTGRPRQRDVWVEWLVGGHYTMRALISCKYWNKTLDESDLDHFNGEFQSSNAHLGIIYARRGFNDLAIEKAKELGFHCCKLYRNQPADLPPALILNVYHLRPAFLLSVNGRPPTERFTYWKELFSLSTSNTTLMEIMVTTTEEFQSQIKRGMDWPKMRAGVSKSILAEHGGRQLEISLKSFFRFYVARIDYTMLSGSYNITDNQFMGKQSMPLIDAQSAHPGPGWSLEEFPETLPSNHLTIFGLGDWREMLTAKGEEKIADAIDPPTYSGAINPNPDEVDEIWISTT